MAPSPSSFIPSTLLYYPPPPPNPHSFLVPHSPPTFPKTLQPDPLHKPHNSPHPPSLFSPVTLLPHPQNPLRPQFSNSLVSRPPPPPLLTDIYSLAPTTNTLLNPTTLTISTHFYVASTNLYFIIHTSQHPPTSPSITYFLIPPSSYLAQAYLHPPPPPHPHHTSPFPPIHCLEIFSMRPDYNLKMGIHHL
jgi:hypothetical protein